MNSLGFFTNLSALLIPANLLVSAFFGFPSSFLFVLIVYFLVFSFFLGRLLSPSNMETV